MVLLPLGAHNDDRNAATAMRDNDTRLRHAALSLTFEIGETRADQVPAPEP